MIGILTTTIALAISFVDALPSLYSESEICRNGGDLCTKDDMKYELILPAQPGFQYVDIDFNLGVTTILFFSSLLISHCGAPPITDAHPFPPLSLLFPHQMGRRRWLLRIMGHPTRNPHQRCLDFTTTGARSHRARGRPRQ